MAQQRNRYPARGSPIKPNEMGGNIVQKCILALYIMFDHIVEFAQDLVNTMKIRCDKFIKSMHMNLLEGMATTSKQDFGLMYEQDREVVRTKEGEKKEVAKKLNKLSMQVTSTASQDRKSIRCVVHVEETIRVSAGGAWGCAWDAGTLAISGGIVLRTLVLNFLWLRHLLKRRLPDLPKVSAQRPDHNLSDPSRSIRLRLHHISRAELHRGQYAMQGRDDSNPDVILGNHIGYVAGLTRYENNIWMSNNNHNLTLRSILDKDKLTGSNFLDWQRNLVIVLRLEKKEYVLEQAIPPVPAANASTAIKDTYEKHVDDDNQVACLMLATMTSDLQKHHESMKAYDMIIHLRQLYQGQARHERFQISKALFSCKLSVGNPVGPHVLKMIGYVQTLEKLGFELRTELATDLILQSLPELYKQFVVNYEMHELDKPLPELLKMLQTAEESLMKGKGNSVLLVQGGKGKKKFKKAKKNGPKGKGNTKPKSNSSKLEPKGGVAKDSICHHCGEVGHWKRNCKQYLATKKKGEASASETEEK
ncbi:unnamed protein product [Cuscuta campestris]|uniref:CCHC-type domain-containing protein n=1 Tax=Cuscuta campestris TaxID=132261 RepID=A0A484KCN7_9ASTE|nr:unnamed protein product [Cuscuta campestris]